MCREHDALELEIGSILKADTVAEEERAQPAVDAVIKRQVAIAQRVAQIPPRTPDGYRALAASIGLVVPSLLHDGSGQHDDMLLSSLLVGLLGLDPVSSSPRWGARA